ncbi:MAG TPA: sulfotransferase domain-containing protein [Gaiellales bacterium]|nr:sulfotransferase domain-containing protein [Gaiellales bacterium]
MTAARLSPRERMLPGFLIVGAQRGGTTSLYRALSQHPLVAKPLWHKGIHYFDLHYERGPGWYRAHFPAAAAGRGTGGARSLTFESSPYYMLHPLAGARIARDLPDVRLLALVRDPVERAYSAHAHEIARGYESEPFERALELEPQRLAGEVERMTADPGYRSHSLQHQSYIHRGQYADQLERLEALVGRDRLHVIDSGDFFRDPAPVYDRVVEFLGLPAAGYPVFDRHNARPRQDMPEPLRRELREHFRPYDARLERWLGEAPSWRRGEAG